jgi:hypothetical protein
VKADILLGRIEELGHFELRQPNMELHMSIDEALNRGKVWYKEHAKHVAKILHKNPSKTAIKPTGSDLIHPELWKAIHWRWFMSRLHVRPRELCILPLEGIQLFTDAVNSNPALPKAHSRTPAQL